MADPSVPDWIVAHVRKYPNGETTRRVIVSEGRLGVSFDLFATMGEIVRPSDFKGRHRPAEAQFSMQLDMWPSVQSETGPLSVPRKTDWKFQSYESGSLGSDILPLWRALFVTSESEVWPSVLPRESGKFFPLGGCRPVVEIALNGDLFEVIIHSDFQPMVWLAFRKQALIDEFVSQFRDMERKLEMVAQLEALHQPTDVDGQHEEEDEMQLEDYLFEECFDD